MEINLLHDFDINSGSIKKEDYTECYYSVNYA